jgi:hypothetical protein
MEMTASMSHSLLEAVDLVTFLEKRKTIGCRKKRKQKKRHSPKN